MNENVQMKSITVQNIAVRRKQIVFGATLILLANNLMSNHFIQLWWCLTLEFNLRSNKFALTAN